MALSQHRTGCLLEPRKINAILLGSSSRHCWGKLIATIAWLSSSFASSVSSNRPCYSWEGCNTPTGTCSRPSRGLSWKFSHSCKLLSWGTCILREWGGVLMRAVSWGSKQYLSWYQNNFWRTVLPTSFPSFLSRLVWLWALASFCHHIFSYRCWTENRWFQVLWGKV